MRRAPTYDCGALGQLTARQIAARAGIKRATVAGRVRAGIRGEAICAPPLSHAQRIAKKSPSYCMSAPGTTGNLTIATAVRVAMAYRHAPPTAAQLVRDFGMTISTAYRWRAAFIDAMGLPA